MRLIDIVNGPWAILNETHQQIHDIYRRHLKGDKIDIKDLGIEKRDPLASTVIHAAAQERNSEQRGTYSVIDNVAIIPVHDVIAKRMTWVMEICGGCSSQILQRDIAEAQNDPAVKGIILYFDTPGGTVDGTSEAADLIAGYRGNKPVIGFSDGMICSAGYWLAAPCDEIYISSNTNPIGSIGVVAGHVDVSERERMMGRRTTEITAGDFKRIASGYSPLSSEGRAYIQAQLDHIYTGFTDFVSSCRGLEIADHTEWANGRVFLGSQAISAGLVDGVSTLGELIDRISGQAQGRSSNNRIKKAGAGVVAAKTISEKEVVMTSEELQAKHPELFQQVLDEGKAAATAENDATVAEAVKNERQKVVALVSAGFGEEAGKKLASVAEKGLTAQDVSDLGISFAPVATLEGTADEDSRKQILTELKKGGQQPVGQLAKGQDDDFDAKVTAYRKEHACGRGTAISAVAKAHPDLHKAWLEGQKK